MTSFPTTKAPICDGLFINYYDYYHSKLASLQTAKAPIFNGLFVVYYHYYYCFYYLLIIISLKVLQVGKFPDARAPLHGTLTHYVMNV